MKYSMKVNSDSHITIKSKIESEVTVAVSFQDSSISALPFNNGKFPDR